ncbi:MAG: SLC13 family permease, partial [candidate division WOR-3 bacterium]
MRKPLFVFGPLAFLICLILPLDRSAAVVIGTIFWMASWWISEVIPLGITALLPLIIAPLFGIAPANEISLNYAKSPIFLFLGGFILARAIEKYNIHRFLAANIIRLFGKSELGIFIGISLATYFLSMWISNTSTTMIMIPLILSLQVGSLLKALAFTAAYSSSIGGMATLVGTPPNIIYAGTLRNFGLEITFLDWLKFGLPYSLLLETAFLVFSSFVFKLSIRKVDVKTYDIALDSKGKAVLFIFIITAILWITLPLWEKTFGLKADDSTIAIFSGVLLFVLGFMGWDDIKDIPWDALLLFGGGFALSDMIVKGKLSDLILNYLSGLKGFPPLFFVAVWSAFV